MTIDFTNDKNTMKELFLISCVSHKLVETSDSVSPDLEDHIELGALLYYMSHDHGVRESRRLADLAVTKIRRLWDENGGHVTFEKEKE